MSMSNSTRDVVESTSWSDVELRGVAWVNGGRDLVLRLGLDTRDSMLVCSWANAVAVEITLPPGRGGFPLTWGAAFEESPDGTWSVRFDFGGDGALRFSCNDIELHDWDLASGVGTLQEFVVDYVGTRGGARGVVGVRRDRRAGGQSTMTDGLVVADAPQPGVTRFDRRGRPGEAAGGPTDWRVVGVRQGR